MYKGHFNHKKIKDYPTLKKEFIKSAFDTMGSIALLLFINQVTSPHHFWARIPVIIMVGILMLKGFRLAGKKFVQEITETARPGYSYNYEPYDHLELKDLNSRTEKQSQKLWKESELVKSNLN